MNLRMILILLISLILLSIAGVEISNYLNKTLYGGEGNSAPIVTENSMKKIVLNINESVKFSNIKITINGVYRTQKIKGTFGYQILKNNETFIIVKVRIDNLRNDSSYYISSMDFYLIDNNGKKYDCDMDTIDIENGLTITTIKPHDHVEGYLVYKIPKSVKTIGIVYVFRDIKNIFNSRVVIWKINTSEIPYIPEFPENS